MLHDHTIGNGYLELVATAVCLAAVYIVGSEVLIPNADLDLLDQVEDIDLCEDEMSTAKLRCVPQGRKVQPSATPGAASGSAVLMSYAPYGDSVFVIDEKKNAKTGSMEKVLRQQFIRLGAARGDFVAVLTGLKVGEQIVTTGVFKLRPNLAVVIDNKLAPNAQLAPKPDNS